MKQSRPERILDRRTRLQIKVTTAAVLVIMTAAAVAGIATGPRLESSHAQEPHGGEAQAASQNVTRVGSVLHSTAAPCSPRPPATGTTPTTCSGPAATPCRMDSRRRPTGCA